MLGRLFCRPHTYRQTVLSTKQGRRIVVSINRRPSDDTGQIVGAGCRLPWRFFTSYISMDAVVTGRPAYATAQCATQKTHCRHERSAVCSDHRSWRGGGGPPPPRACCGSCPIHRCETGGLSRPRSFVSCGIIVVVVITSKIALPLEVAGWTGFLASSWNNRSRLRHPAVCHGLGRVNL
jgi:hypothetical protein